jgi:hypothetical protein
MKKIVIMLIALGFLLSISQTSKADIPPDRPRPPVGNGGGGGNGGI